MKEWRHKRDRRERESERERYGNVGARSRLRWRSVGVQQGKLEER